MLLLSLLAFIAFSSHDTPVSRTLVHSFLLKCFFTCVVSCHVVSCHVVSCHVVRLCVITVASYGATNELLTKPNRAPPPQRPNTHQTITKPHLPAPMNQWTLPHGNHQQHFSATACAPPPLHFAHNHNTLDNTLDLFVTLASFICLCLCVCVVCV